VQESEQSDDLSKRLASLCKSFTLLLYQNVCRSLFERHKLLFAFILASKLQLDQGIIAGDELRFLLTGGIAMGDNKIPNPDPSWISDAKWGEMCRLETLCDTRWEGFALHISQNVHAWKAIYDSANPAAQHLPAPWHNILSSFQRMAALRTIRMDKIVPSMTQYVTESLGPEYAFRATLSSPCHIFLMAPLRKETSLWLLCLS
jgi:dynein heavy chain, axonemal